MEDLTGKQLGPYQIVAPLGEGGMAAVYKAYQPSIDRYVALKVLPRHFADDPEFIQRFKQEARVIANLQHPHILPVHDFGEAEGYTYMAMRFIRGGELSEWMQTNAPISLPQIRRIITQIGDALDYAHSQNIIHRDIKPSNVLIDERGNCLLTDFGLAKMMETSVKLTRTGGILGTPAYMSPEQGMGQGVDHRSDIYALGVILYEMVTGRPPYQAETPMAIMIKHIQAPLPPPNQYNPDLPESVERVILKALAKNKEDRFATAGEMVQALQRATEQPTIATGAEPPTIAGIVPPRRDEAETAVSTPPSEPERKTAVPTTPPRKRRTWLYAAIG
ncbi:MAG: serine/threonine protein kinase, partial [Anaerolineales bacterium]|nr:serine/threonine protein kinase [Anaerolineales bacterium]